MKRIHAVLLAVLAACAGLIGFVFAQNTPGQREWGPYTCNSCSLPFPDPNDDRATYNQLSTLWLSLISNKWRPEVGETVTLCNETGCVVYKRQMNDFYGIQRTPKSSFPVRNDPPGSGGDGGGGMGGGTSGGSNPPNPGGSGGGGTGQVNIGKVRPV